MKSVKQLLRQPLKTLFGILLMTLAAAILCVTVGQAVAAQTTKMALNERFSTVAIPVIQESSRGEANADSFRLEKELLNWLEEMAREHPDIIKSVSRHGFLSAYIPELTPYNVTSEKYIAETITSRDHYEYYRFQSDPYAMPYSCAMLVITLDEVSAPTKCSVSYAVETDLNSNDFSTESDYQQWLESNPDMEFVTVDNYYQVELVGTVTDVVSLANGYRDPVGRFARLTYTATTLEEIQALELVPGEQYIVYGMNYFDEFWALIGTMNYDGKYNHVAFEPYDPSLFRFLYDWEIERNKHLADAYPVRFGYMKDLYAVYNHISITKKQYLQLNAISMDLSLPVHYRAYEDIRDENGKLLELKPVTTVSLPGANGESVTFTIDEYNARYQIPTITKLEGSVEDFLVSDVGEQWRSAMERDAINNHAFAVIGVEKLNYLANFSMENIKIVEGRDFTKEELEGDARVCLVQESVAKSGGLSVGDTITLNLYPSDFTLPYQSYSWQEKGLLNPTASFYFDTTPIVETAQYTIVGFWRDETAWPNVAENAYGYCANTVFVPKTSVQTQMETRNSVQLIMPVLQNGKINEFHDLTMNSGYAGRFKYNDQGYSKIAGNFHNYEQLAQHVLLVGVVIYVVLLFLFLLLYPSSQKNAVKIMASLGAHCGKRFGYVLLSSMGLVIPAAALGGMIGFLLWKHVVAAIQATAEFNLPLQLESETIVVLATAQLLLTLVLTAVVAVFIASNKGISSRR